jgi:hypothetical protein
MNGLLGTADDPRTMGLLSMGLRLMSTPGKFGSAFGQAGLGALGDMQQAQQMQEQRKRAGLQEQLVMLQLAQAKQQQEQAAAAQARKTRDDEILAGSFRPMPGPMPDGQAGVQPRFDIHGMLGRGLSMDSVPEAIRLQQVLNPPRKLRDVAPGASVIDEANPTKPLYTAPKEEAATSDWKDFQKNVAGGYKGSFLDYQREMANLKAPKGPTVNVGAPEREFDKELAKLDAKQLDAYRDSADKSAGAVARVRAMRGAVEGGVYSGSFAGDRAKLANFFATLGAPGIDLNKLANTQEYQKHAKELVLSVLKEGVGSTNISNADLAFVNDTVPQLETSPVARKRLLDYIEGRSQSNIDKFRAADAYARQNRGMGGFQPPPPKAPVGGGWKIERVN